MIIAQWLGALFFGVLLVILWQLRQLILVIFGAIVLSVALDTLSRIPQRYGYRRGSSLVMTILTVNVMLVILLLIVVPPLYEQFNELFKLLTGILVNAEPEDFTNWFEGVREWLNRLPLPLAEPLDLSTDTDPTSPPPQLRVGLPTVDNLLPQLTNQVLTVIGQSFNLVSSSLTILINLFLLAILTLLLLVDPPSYVNAFIIIFPAFYRERIRYILTRCEETLRSWLIGILITSTFVTVMSGIALFILQIPLVLANAVLAGLFNFIPNIGPTLSVVAPMVVVLAVPDVAPWKAAWILVLYVGIQQLETYAVTPYVMSRQVSLLPGLTLLAQVAFATFFGILGLLLAVPLAAVLQVWVQEVLIHDVLDPWRAPPPLLEKSPHLHLSVIEDPEQ